MARQPNRPARGADATPTGPPASCSSSPGRARSGSAWAVSCSRTSPRFARPWSAVRPPCASTRPGRCSRSWGQPRDARGWPRSTWCSRSLFSVQVALAALWRSWGVEPAAVVGHSMGEVAAAHVAGALSLADAARVICSRSRLQRRVSGRGAMAVVALPLDEARATVAPVGDRLSVGASNGPTSTVLSGDPAALEHVLEGLRARNVFCRLVKIDVASHSPQMEELREDLVRALAGLAPRAPVVPFYSTVTAERLPGAALTPEYWARNLREPVLFHPAVQRLLESGCGPFLELSPHPILLAPIEETLHAAGAQGTGPPVAVPRAGRARGPALLPRGALCLGTRDRMAPPLSRGRPRRPAAAVPLATEASLGRDPRGRRLSRLARSGARSSVGGFGSRRRTALRPGMAAARCGREHRRAQELARPRGSRRRRRRPRRTSRRAWRARESGRGRRGRGGRSRVARARGGHHPRRRTGGHRQPVEPGRRGGRRRGEHRTRARSRVQEHASPVPGARADRDKAAAGLAGHAGGTGRPPRGARRARVRAVVGPRSRRRARAARGVGRAGGSRPGRSCRRGTDAPRPASGRRWRGPGGDPWRRALRPAARREGGDRGVRPRGAPLRPGRRLPRLRRARGPRPPGRQLARGERGTRAGAAGAHGSAASAPRGTASTRRARPAGESLRFERWKRGARESPSPPPTFPTAMR